MAIASGVAPDLLIFSSVEAEGRVARRARPLAQTVASRGSQVRKEAKKGFDRGDAGAQALMNSPYLRNLTSLSMKDNPLSDDARAALRAHFGDKVHL